MSDLIKLIGVISELDGFTLFVLLVAFLAFLFVFYKVSLKLIDYFKSSFSLKVVLSFISTLTEIIVKYELKTVAGLIDLLLTLGLLSLTLVALLTPADIASFLGVGITDAVFKKILIISTVLSGFASLYALYKFDRNKQLLQR